MKQSINKIINSKVLKNSIWLTILQVVNTVIPFLTVPYITRVLGTNEYGLFSITLNWILYLQVFVEFGFGLSGSRKVALMGEKESNKLNELYNNIISSRIILLIVSFILLNIIAFFSHFSLRMYICIMILFLIIFGTTFQLTWLFQGKQDMKFITIINVISRTISLILIFLSVKSEKDIYLYCFLYSITLVLSSIISILVARKKYGLKFKFASLSSIKEEINDGKYLFASSAMSKIFSGFGVTILGIFATASLTGIFAAIYKIPYVLSMFFYPISQALYPFNSSNFKKDFDTGVRSVKKICIPVFTFFLLISIFIVIFRKIIVNILFGTEYLDYSIIVIPLIIQFLFGMINNFLGIQILVASGNNKKYSQAFTIGCVSIVILNILLGKIYGIYGVSYAAMIGEIVLTLSLIYKFKTIDLICRRKDKND